MKITLDRVCRRSGVDLLLHTTLVQVWRQNERVAGITVFDRKGLRKFIADAFVDAGGECDLVVPCKNKRYILKSFDESSSGQN